MDCDVLCSENGAESGKVLAVNHMRMHASLSARVCLCISISRVSSKWGSFVCQVPTNTRLFHLVVSLRLLFSFFVLI